MNSSLFTPRRIFIAVAIIALLLLLRECCRHRDNGATAPDQVNIRYDAAPTNLNPFNTVQGTDLYTCARIFQTLCDVEPKTLELTPTLIVKIPAVRTVQDGPHAGQLAFDFEILPEAVWDNGTPVTGNDMAFSLKIIFHPLMPSPFKSYFKDMSGVDVDPANPKKFIVYFRQYYFMAMESMTQIPVMPVYNYDPANHITNIPLADFLDTAKVKTLEADPGMKAFSDEFLGPKFARDPNSITGSGPYKMQTMNDQGVILVKKENWWGDKLSATNQNLEAYPKRLVYKFVKDENVIENMLKNGELDIVCGSISAAKFLEMRQKDSLTSRYNFDLLPALQYSRWIINMTKPNLKDPLVRQALAHIVDYDHFIKNIRMNLAVRTSSPVLPAKRYYAKDLVPYDFNIPKAKELLAQAGWRDSNGDGIVDKTVNGQNEKLVIEVLVPPIHTNQQYAQSLTETARLAGIELKTVTMDITEITPTTKSGNYETALIAAALSVGQTELSQRYYSQNIAPLGDNRSRYINTKLDTIINMIGAEPDDSKRDKLYIEAQKIIYDDLPEVFLLAPTQPIITSKKFEGVITPNRPGYYEQMFKLK